MCIRCTTAARWGAGKTLETENVTTGENPEEWCTWHDRKVMIIELGDDRTADDESDGKLYIIWKKEQFSTRPRRCEKKRPHATKNIDGPRVQPDLFGDRKHVSDDAKRLASEVGLK